MGSRAAAVLLILAAGPVVAQTDATLRATLQGDPAAQVRVGYEFRDGRNRKADHREAAKWFGKAAQNGNPEAIDNLGWLYEQGMGVPRSATKARALYLRSARKGHSEPVQTSPARYTGTRGKPASSTPCCVRPPLPG